MNKERRTYYCGGHTNDGTKDNLNKANQRQCVKVGCRLMSTKIGVKP